MNRDPPDPFIPAMKKFMRQTTKGLTRHSNRLLQQLKRTYLLMLLFQVPTLTLSKPCCLRARINDIVHLIPFDNTSRSIIALDNCATNHIFGDESNFHGGIIPMDPIDVTGLGDGTATGYGNVKLEFTRDNGKRYRRILYSTWYLPSASVRMISIPQLDLQVKERTQGKE